MAVLGRQNLVQFFDKNQEFLAVLFYRDEGTKLVNALAIRWVHNGVGSITGFTLAGMFDVERSKQLGPGLASPFATQGSLRSQFTHSFDMVAERGGEFFQDSVRFHRVGGSHRFG
jgi:hypothetical protein